MFANNIRKLRKLRGLTQMQFAEEFNISNGTIAMWETGKREPDFKTAIKIANYFAVTMDYLLGNENGIHSTNILEKGELCMNDFKFVTTEYHPSLMEDFHKASKDEKLSILAQYGIPPSLVSYFNTHINQTPAKKELSEEGYQIGAAYEQADSGTKSSIRKLLDIPEKTKTPTRCEA